MSGAEKYCLGCGEDMDSKKIYDRGMLCSVAGEVREIWKEVMSAKLTICELELDIEKMVGTQENPCYICRSCFGKYKTLAKLQDELSEKAGKALQQERERAIHFINSHHPNDSFQGMTHL